MSYLVFDIETVPDSSVWTPPEPKEEIPRLKKEREKAPTKAELGFLDLVTSTLSANKPVHTADLEKAYDLARLVPQTYKATAEKLKQLIDVRKLEEDGEVAPFPPLFAHRPVAIGYVVLGDDFTFQNFGCAGTTNMGGEEATLLSGFGQFAGGHTLVSFGGKSFDVPVIMLRSFKNGVGHAWCTKDHRYRYDENRHLDLKLALSDYESYKKGFSLDTFSKLCGLPGKDGVDGSMVAQMYDEGKHAEIENYCRVDALETAVVFLRFMLMRGRLRLERYQEVASMLLAAWNSWNPEQAAKIDTKALLLSE